VSYVPAGLPKPYFEDDAVQIYLGDCRDILPHLGPVDLVLTDPPYNVGKDYGDAYFDSMVRADYDNWITTWWELLPTHRRIVFPAVGNLYLWAKREPVATACWYKPGATGRANPFQWNEWEPILVWGVTFTGSDVFRSPISAQRDVGDHPCPKPLQLFHALLARLRTPGTVLDPFMGSGTTLRAAKDLGRKAIGIEIEEKYCFIAAERMRQSVLPLKVVNDAEST
jgi:DNA modification methylase